VNAFNLDICEYSIPFLHQLVTAANSYNIRRGYHIVLRFHDTFGLGEAAPLPGFNIETMENCLNALLSFKTRIEKLKNIGSTAVLIRLVHQCTKNSPAARFGLETAVFDASSRNCNLPLNRYLNEDAADLVKVNALYHPDIQIPDQIDCLKIKLASGSVEDDLLLVEQIIENLDKNTQLRLDFNGKLDFKTARQVLPGFTKFNIDYFEQPVDHIDAAGLRELNKITGIPIALDNYPEYIKLLDDTEADDRIGPLIIKPMVVGGFFQTRRILNSARKKNIRTVITSSLESHIGRQALLHLVSAYDVDEYNGLLTGSLLNEPVEHQFEVVNSRIKTPSSPGLGVDYAH